MIESTFNLPAFVLSCKKSGYIFWSPMTRLATPIFDHVHPTNFVQLLTVMNLHQHAKNPFAHSSDKVNFRVPSRLATSIFDHANP